MEKRWMVLILKALYTLLAAIILHHCHSDECSQLCDEIVEYWEELEQAEE